MDNVKNFIVDYIQREYTIPDNVDIMSLNYIDEGYIDSMGFIQFIATIEDEFNIEFSVDEMNRPDIKVVGSLVDLIVRKIESSK